MEKDEYNAYQVKFASKYVEKILFQAIDKRQRQGHMMFLQESGQNHILLGIRGQLLEDKAHQLNDGGGNFTIHKLSTNYQCLDVEIEHFTLLHRDVGSPTYLIPSAKNFESIFI